MVHVSTQFLLTALAVSPALAAPFGVQQFEDAEARDFDDVEARAGALTAAKMFGTFATAVGMGNVFGGFFKKKPAPAQPGKRSFLGDSEEFSTRAMEEDFEYVMMRDEDGSVNVYARSPISGGGLIKIGQAIGKVKHKLFGSSKYVLPAVAAGGVAVGTAAGRQANSARNLEQEDLSSRAVEENTEYLLVRDEDGSVTFYARSPISGGGLIKIGQAIGKVKHKLFGSSKYVLPAVAAGGVAVGTAAGRQANSARSLEEDGEIMVVRGEDGELYVRAPGIAGLAKIGSLIKKATSVLKTNSAYTLPIIAAGGVAAGVASREKTLRTRDFDEELFERLFYNDEEYVERELDELD